MPGGGISSLRMFWNITRLSQAGYARFAVAIDAEL